MKAQVVGIGARRTGTGKKSGKPYDGTSVYVLTAANDVTGNKAEELYFNHLSTVDYPDVSIGDVLNIEYDRNGFLTDISITKKAGA